jgi:hypothetical protein
MEIAVSVRENKYPQHVADINALTWFWLRYFPLTKC